MRIQSRLSSGEDDSLRAQRCECFLRDQDFLNCSMDSSRSELISPLTIFAGSVAKVRNIDHGRIRAVNGQAFHAQDLRYRKFEIYRTGVIGGGSLDDQRYVCCSAGREVDWWVGRNGFHRESEGRDCDRGYLLWVARCAVQA